jgi:hypothetical protein
MRARSTYSYSAHRDRGYTVDNAPLLFCDVLARRSTMRCVTVTGLLAFLSLTRDISAVPVTQFQTETSTGYLPLTTGFTPAPECSSLTIVHSQRYVKVYQGCVGADPSCCPQSRRLENSPYPRACPPGYVTDDAHVGLDPLAADTLQWEATCVYP